MKFLTTGNYSFREQTLEVLAEHADTRYRVQIPVDVFAQRYGTTTSGDFHEYWSSLLHNQEELEQTALRRLVDGQVDDQDTIVVANSDFDRVRD